MSLHAIPFTILILCLLIRKVFFFYFGTTLYLFSFLFLLLWDFFPCFFPYWEVVTGGSAMNKKCDVFWIHLNFWRCCQHTEFSIVFVFTSCLSRNQIIGGGKAITISHLWEFPWFVRRFSLINANSLLKRNILISFLVLVIKSNFSRKIDAFNHETLYQSCGWVLF